MIGAGQPTCLPGPLPPGCTGMLLGARAIHCASYCSEVEHFLAVPRPGGYHDPDMLLVGNSPCSATAAYPRPCPDNNPSCGMHCHQLTHPEEQTQMVWMQHMHAPPCARVCCRVGSTSLMLCSPRIPSASH